MRNVSSTIQGLLLGLFLAMSQSSTVLAGIQCYARDAYSKNFIIAIQETLREHHLEPGIIDGKWGSTTETALAAFQRQSGLPATRDLNGPTLRALFGVNFDTEKYGLVSNSKMPADIFDEHCR
jgi:hypothetical protein